MTVYIDHIMGSVWSGVHDYYTGGVHSLSGQGVSTKNDQLTGVDVQHTKSMHTQKMYNTVQNILLLSYPYYICLMFCFYQNVSIVISAQKFVSS